MMQNEVSVYLVRIQALWVQKFIGVDWLPEYGWTRAKQYSILLHSPLLFNQSPRQEASGGITLNSGVKNHRALWKSMPPNANPTSLYSLGPYLPKSGQITSNSYDISVPKLVRPSRDFAEAPMCSQPARILSNLQGTLSDGYLCWGGNLWIAQPHSLHYHKWIGP